ncbi:MAG TPA: gliding motility lipoprotein GldH [Bacteroidales bacterium]|nr:gliding motility lipoprotein GldH [Bacteroidales bacterium]HPR72182.1 gliding motility lipoprotein GldH [Bacteroidales bacterium]
MIRETNKSLFIIFAVSLILLAPSCHSDLLFTDSVVMPGNTWELSHTPEFSMLVSDTAVNSNVHFTIRTGSDYPFRNIFLFVTTTSPDGQSITDTLQYDLADERGNWYGKGFGDVHELDLPYKTNVFFPLTGTWVFKISHGMRMTQLKGVYDFGIRVQKVNK